MMPFINGRGWTPGRSCARLIHLLSVAMCVAAIARAEALPQQNNPAAEAGAPGTKLPVAIDGPAAPIAPAVITRDEAGRATIRAIKLAEPLHLDGALDESVYESPSIGGFIQQVPREGQSATERTEAWVMFDSDNIYLACRCWDSAPPERWIANELRRDTNQLRQNDTFGVIFDTFYDRRNGFLFYTNPLGARADQAVSDEGNLNVDWNPVWDVRTGRFAGGWTVEMRIPFKSLRYQSGSSQVWGINIRRVIRRKNEWTHLTAIPASAGVPGGMFRLSRAGTVVGLDLPPASKNLELKPYGIARVTTDHLQTPPVANDPDGDIGLDAKYGVTANLTADATINTDFAQVEVDEQQVNLTRFSIVYPEKRDFFLEGRGIFDFARTGAGVPALTPYLFYSRRIGLNGSRVIPIDAGGRLTGKVGPFGVGAMNIQTGDDPVTHAPGSNFTVVRVKRDVLRRSSVGAMLTNRSISSVNADASNLAYGLDGAFSFFQDINVGGYYARSDTEGHTQDNASYLGRFEYDADRYGAQAQYLKVGDNFNPEVGLVRRDDFRRSYGSLRFSPRPKEHFRDVRQFTYQVQAEYIENHEGTPETKNQSANFSMELQNSDRLSVAAVNNYELLVAPFRIANGVIIPPGGYSFTNGTVSYAMGLQRRVSGTLSLQQGEFYDGTITAIGFTSGRVSLLKQWSVEPSVSINAVRLPEGDFNNNIVRGRSDYAFSPRMFLSALVQYGSGDHLFSSNVRFRWEYRGGSELFVVYTDERDTLKPGFPDLRNRAFVVKVNRLLQF